MQTIIATGVVLVCLAAVLRGIWRQFTAKEGAGCGGCSSAANGCSQKTAQRPCANTPAAAVSATVQWHRHSPTD